MKKNWYVVAHRAGARIFEQLGVEQKINLKSSIEHPEGRMSDRERSGSSVGAVARTGGAGMHTLATEHSLSDTSQQVFARSLASQINSAGKRGEFDTLVLVSEPHLLGVLKQELDKGATQKLRETVSKDLARIPDHDVATHLKDVLIVREPVGGSA